MMRLISTITLMVIAVFLGVLVFKPQRVYVTNFPFTQTVDGYISVRGTVEVKGNVNVKGMVEIDESPSYPINVRIQE